MVLLIGYRLGPGRRIAAALSALRGPDRRINVGAAVAGALIVGISAQALIVVRGDGPAAAFEYASEQPTLSESFALFLLAGFATAGVLVWAAWRRPRGRLQWAAFISVVVAVCLFSVAAGSRGRVFVAVLALAVIVHYLWRPWRRREVAVAALLFVLFASSFLAFREVANESSVRAAAEEAPQHVLDLEGRAERHHLLRPRGLCDNDLRARARSREGRLPARRSAVLRAAGHRLGQA